MDLKGKKLLLMGGAAFSQDLKKYADEKGFKMIAVGKDISRLELFADEAYSVDTQDVDSLENIVKTNSIDGIFVGTTEVNIPPAIELSKRTGARFYATADQWGVLSNKRSFKNLLNKFGVETIPEYSIKGGLSDQLYESIEYPVLIKPADSSGARGITIANNPEELKNSYLYAESFSATKKVLVEKLMLDMDDVIGMNSIAVCRNILKKYGAEFE